MENMDKKQKDVYEFLSQHKLAVVSSVAPDSTASGAAVYYVVDDDFNFYFLAHVDSQKYKNLKQNPSAAITVVDDYKQTTIQGGGTVTEVEIGDEHDTAYRKLALIHPPGQFAWVPPVSKIHTSAIALLKLTPSRMLLSRFQDGHADARVEIATKII